MNIEGVTLSLLLSEPDKEASLAHFSELNQDYFSSSFKSVIKVIKDFYLDKGFIPNISELEIYRSRDKKILSALASIRLIDCKGIDIYLAIEELANQYAQNTALDLVDELLEGISTMDRQELTEHISTLPIKMEEKTTSSLSVFTISDIKLFKPREESELDKIVSGISDEWDQESGGYYKQDLVLLGGKRGSGKSLVCANLIVQQHKQKNVSMYFTIEMSANETMERIMAILSQVPYGNIKKKITTPEENIRLASALSSLFEGGDVFLTEYLTKNSAVDLVEFQNDLYSSCKEKEEGRIIIVDDRNLSIGSIDTKIASIKSKYGDALSLVVVDYLNQIVLDSTTDMYDWKPQIIISKTLKNIARKYNICMVSPYQIDDTGSARFSKGILDAPDVAQLIKVPDKKSNHIVLETTKARSSDDTGVHTMTMDWETLTIDPRPVILEELESEDSEGSGKAIPGLTI